MTLSKRAQAHIEAWRQSGLTKSAYCRAQGISANNFYRWCRSETLTKEDPIGRPRLIPVTVEGLTEAPPQSNERIVLHLTQGHRLELPANVSSRWLGEFLQCLA